jgi:hypothetical protein
MRRANPQLLLLVFAMNIVITAAVVLFATRGIRDTAVFLGILATLVVAYLLRRRARIRLLYQRDTDRHPNEPRWPVATVAKAADHPEAPERAPPYRPLPLALPTAQSDRPSQEYGVIQPRQTFAGNCADLSGAGTVLPPGEQLWAG